MSTRANWCIVAVALAFFASGAVLSRRVEPGVRVEAVTLAGDIPALQFLPADSGSRPIALLAHGFTASKESLFRFGEALAAAGFVCFAVDFPGHGESARSFSAAENGPTLERVARTLGSVDVFAGHSMGAYAGAEAVRNAGLSPRLFIAVGALPELGEHGPPLLLLAGQFDEALARARRGVLPSDARLVRFSWSDHALEPYDPRLVDAAVDAACAAVGKTRPPAPTCWRWRLTGVVLGMLGALTMAPRLPELSPRLAQVRGPLLSVIVIGALAVTTTTWFDAAPHLRRAALQIVAIAIALLVVMGAGRLRIPRWSFPALAAAVAIGCVIVGAYFLALIGSLFALVLFAATVLGWIAAHRGSRRDGDIAMAMLVGYAIGQWMPGIL
jgi:pimeloyl-ACP methyl ester carboxylesterase